MQQGYTPLETFPMNRVSDLEIEEINTSREGMEEKQLGIRAFCVKRHITPESYLPVSLIPFTICIVFAAITRDKFYVWAALGVWLFSMFLYFTAVFMKYRRHKKEINEKTVLV
jgi:hypothetical protein